MERIVEHVLPADVAPAASPAQGGAGEQPWIYVVGGLDKAFENTNIAWRLQPGQDAWEELPSLAAPRSGAIAAAADGFLYVLGGEDHGDALREVHRFDPAARKWQDMAPMLEGRIRGVAVAAGGFLYVFGGQDGLSPISSAERFDPTTSMWTALPPMQRTRYASAATTMPDGKIMVFGGDLTEDGAGCSAERYDPNTESWELLPSMPVPAGGASLAIAQTGGRAFAIGGIGLSGQALPAAEQAPLDALMRAPAAAWAPVARLHEPRHLASVAGFGAGLVVVAGKGPNFEAMTSVELYDAEENTWTQLPPLPAARIRVAVGVL